MPSCIVSTSPTAIAQPPWGEATLVWLHVRSRIRVDPKDVVMGLVPAPLRSGASSLLNDFDALEDPGNGRSRFTEAFYGYFMGEARSAAHYQVAALSTLQNRPTGRSSCR